MGCVLLPDSIINQHNYDINVQSDKLQLLYYQSFPAVFFSLAVAFSYASILWAQLNQNELIIWLSLVVISSFIRLYLFLTYRRQTPKGQDVLKWEKPYFITLMMSSTIWGVGAVLLSYNLSFLYRNIHQELKEYNYLEKTFHLFS